MGIWLLVALAALTQGAAAPPNEDFATTFKRWKAMDDEMGPGPHTLVIADGSAIERIDYKTGQACKRARDEVRRQVTPAPERGVIHGPPTTKAFCVPR